MRVITDFYKVFLKTTLHLCHWRHQHSGKKRPWPHVQHVASRRFATKWSDFAVITWCLITSPRYDTTVRFPRSQLPVELGNINPRSSIFLNNMVAGWFYYDKVMFSIGGNDMNQLLRLKFVSEWVMFCLSGHCFLL